MPRRSSKKRAASSAAEEIETSRSSLRGRHNRDNRSNDESNANPQPPPQQRSVASHVRERQRAVAEREAARLARPEAPAKALLAHADRKKSAVSSTPSGYIAPSKKKDADAWCGPLSVARQMIAQRQEAKRREEQEKLESQKEHHPLDQAMEELEQEAQRQQHPSLLWKSNATFLSTMDEDDEKNGKKKAPSLYARRERRASLLGGKGQISSLYDLCIQFLVDHFEHVESVGHMDSSIRKRLGHDLVARNMLNDTALQALCVPGMEALELVDSSGITAEALQARLRDLIPAGLCYLALDQAGRCFTPKTAQGLIEQGIESGEENKSTTALQALAIGGAYLLKDENAAQLVSSLEPTLQSLEFKACPLVNELFCKSLTQRKKLVLRELALEDLTFSETAWASLLSAASHTTFWSHQLESLRLKRMEGLDDDKMGQLLAKPEKLTALDLSLNPHLSDVTLGHLRASPSCGVVNELRLSGLRGLTAAGLEALFTVAPDLATPPPCLRVLDVGQCQHEAVTDAVVERVARASSSVAAHDTNNNDRSSKIISSSSLGLAHLNLQGSSGVTDTSLEVLVTTCGSTLQELHVSYCTQLTNQGLGYLVDHCGPQLSCVQVWGNAQLSEIFFDGHHRTQDPSLQIVGAWMKKNSALTIR